MRLEAEAKNSSVRERMWELRGAERRSVVVGVVRWELYGGGEVWCRLREMGERLPMQLENVLSI